MVVNPPLGMLLNGTGLFFFIAAVVIQKSLLAIEQEEHGAIKLLAQRKLESIAHIISHAIQQGTISFIELHRALQEIE